MSSLTDMIEATILDLMEDQDGACEIGRNAFAAELQVAPSQISYVISTRFSHRQGYLVESRRGAGYVKIRRLPYTDEADYLMQLACSMADSLSQHDATVMIDQLEGMQLISLEMALLMKAAIDDHSLNLVDIRRRDAVRSRIFRNMLTRAAALTESEVNP